MIFDLERTTYPSQVHAQIAFAGKRLTPLDIALAGMEDPALRHSCEDLHAFLLGLLTDMYEQPGAYGLPVYALETFLNGRKENRVKREQPSKTKALIAQTRNAAESYIDLLFALGSMGEAAPDRLVLPAGAIEACFAKAKTTNSAIAAEMRRAGLARVGFIQEGDVIVCPGHSAMFTALVALARTAGKGSGMPKFNRNNLEFRQLLGPYKPTYADYVRVLPANRRQQADRLDAAARALRIKPVINTFWKVDYKYKGAQVMCMDTLSGSLDIRIIGTYYWDDPALINDRLAAEAPALQREVRKNMWFCTACATSHLGRFVTVLGDRVRVCGGGAIAFRWHNPAEDSLPHMERCLALRCEIVDALRAAGKNAAREA